MYLSLKENRRYAEVIDEYDFLGMPKHKPYYHIINDWQRLKMKERIRELEGRV